MVTVKNNGKQKRVRIDDFLNPGDGYDTQDSFIDDSEAIDVFVAPNISTKFGGYFVHQGTVEGLEDTSVKIEAPWNARILANNSSTHNAIRKKNKSKELLDKAVKRLSTPSAFKPKLFSSESRNQMRNLDSVFDEVLSSPNTPKENNAKDVNNCQNSNEKCDNAPVSVPVNLTSDVEKLKPLPKNLPAEIVACLNNLTELNKCGAQQRRTMGKPFDMELLKLDTKLKELMLNQSVRSEVFHYLESHLQLKHKAVMRRLKKLREDKQEERMNPLLDSLGEAISSSMPPIIESYTRDKEVHLERIKAWQTENLQNNGTEFPDSQGAANGSGDGNSSKRIPKPGPPKKIYRWNSECRQLFEKIILCRLESYKLLNIKGSAEDYLRRLFPTLIQLWPDGWITNAALWRSALPIFQKFCNDHGLCNNTSTSQSTAKSSNNSSNNNNTNANLTNSNNGRNSNPVSSANASYTSDSSILSSQNSPVVILPNISNISTPVTVSKTTPKITATSLVTNTTPRASLPAAATATATCSPKLNSIPVTKYCQSPPVLQSTAQTVNRPNFRITPSSVAQNPNPNTKPTTSSPKVPLTLCVDTGSSRISYVLQSNVGSVSPNNSLVVPVAASSLSPQTTSQFNRTPILQNEAIIGSRVSHSNATVPLRLVSSSSTNPSAATTTTPTVLLSKTALQLNSELGGGGVGSAGGNKPAMINPVAVKRQSYPQSYPSQQSANTHVKINDLPKSSTLPIHNEGIPKSSGSHSSANFVYDASKFNQPIAAHHHSAAALLSNQQIDQLQSRALQSTTTATSTTGRIGLNINPALSAAAAALLFPPQPPPAHQSKCSSLPAQKERVDGRNTGSIPAAHSNNNF
ncbi:unnamed protein product [Trichobilharzia szidati]|nr:unnamed protein product [Trichobilharzia szidati]